MENLAPENQEEFLYHYQKTHFKENHANHFVKCNFKRQSLHQILQAAQRVTSNETTCHILKTKLVEYSALVDKSDGVNNYSSSVLDLVSHSSSDSIRWVSKSNASDLMYELLQPSSGECHSKTTEGCSAQKPSKTQLEVFLKNKKALPTFVKYNNRPNVNPVLQQPHSKTSGQLPSFSGCKPPNQSTKRTADEVTKSQLSCKTMNTIQSRVFGTTRSSVTDQAKPQNKPQFAPSFRTAGTELKLQNSKKYGQQVQGSASSSSGSCGGDTFTYGNNKKSLGGRTRSVNNKFVPPVKSNSQEDGSSQPVEGEDTEDEQLKLIDPKLVDLIRSEIMDHGPPVHWDDIAGLQFAKATIQEIVVLPMLRPDIFTGLRRPPKGILLFGPPGTGKTLIGKCIASQSQSTFFNISASSLTSKWVGEGEKMVRTLFTLARVHQPAVVFIDEIDSLLSQRSETEHESSRRIKTEFLVQLDGAGTGEEDRILVIGATNRPQELDEAARRRLVKRLYIPLPDHQARCQLVNNLMCSERHELTLTHVEEIAALTDGYSGADMKTLCQEACMGPIRAINFTDIQHITPDQVRPVTVEDFRGALMRVRSSVSPRDLESYITWDQTYGSGGAPK